MGENYPRWLLRFVLDNEKINFKHLSMGHIEDKLNQFFPGFFNIVRSDDNSENLVLRLRALDFESDDND